MIDAADDRQRWRLQWLGCVAELSNDALQRRMWLDTTNTNPHWSYVEFMCSYSDDTLLGFPYEWQVQRGYLSTDEASAVAGLDDLLKSYEPPGGDEYNHTAILGDTHWQAVVNAGKAAVEALAELLTDPQERRFLMEQSTRDCP